MARANGKANTTSVGVEDLVPVGSRVSWGAIFAGAVVAMAIYLVMTLLGGAIGLSVSDRVRPENIATGGAGWAIISTAVALLVGGFVTTLCTVGENKTEAVIHGVLMWGVVFAMMLALAATALRAGFGAMVGMASISQSAGRDTNANWEDGARRAGVSQQTIDEARSRANNTSADDPATRQAARENATRATWFTLLGTLMSMATAIGGALAGAGPTFRLMTVRVPANGNVGFGERQGAGVHA